MQINDKFSMNSNQLSTCCIYGSSRRQNNEDFNLIPFQRYMTNPKVIFCNYANNRINMRNKTSRLISIPVMDSVLTASLNMGYVM